MDKKFVPGCGTVLPEKGLITPRKGQGLYGGDSGLIERRFKDPFKSTSS